MTSYAPGSKKILVPRFTGARDSLGNPIVETTQMEFQNIQMPGGRNYIGLLAGDETPSSGVLVVADNDFSNVASLFLGPYQLDSNTHFTVGGSTDLTATALETAINNLTGYSAQRIGSTITISGPSGLEGYELVFRVKYKGTVTNYTLTPNDGFLTNGLPTVGPVSLT